MKVCFICSEYPPGPHGGEGTFTQLMARALVRRGHDVRVAGVYPRSYPSPEWENDQGVEVWRLKAGKRRLSWIADRLRLYRLVADWQHKGEIDLVESPDWQGWFAGWPRFGVPMIHRSNGSGSYRLSETGQRKRVRTFWMEKWSYSRTSHWCSVSQYTADKTRELFGLRQPPSAILYNPIEIPPTCVPFEQRHQGTVIFTGSLVQNKGVIQLIDAWMKLQKQHPTAELHMYGKDGLGPDGSAMSLYLKKRLEVSPDCNVQFHGHVPRDEVYTALRSARLAVFPSYSEAFAHSVLEAMAVGCPVVYTRRASGPEVIDHNETGLLVDPAQPADISSAISSLIDDNALARRLGAAGRHMVSKRFSLDTLVLQNERFYETCRSTFGKA